MPPPQGTASYKKQNGIIAIATDRKSVSWTPSQPANSSPALVINAAGITNLQQTPESNPKVMLKIFTQDPGQTEPLAHVFSFTSQTSARSEANAVKDALASVIQAQKQAQIAAQNASAGGTSAAMTIANALSRGSRSGNVWEDDERLKSDVKLQQSLMVEDPTLQKTFLEARSMKPDSISNTQFTAQFWSSRVHLLRAHALAKGQNRGSYNVFSTLRKEEGGTRLNLNAEQIHMIFAQYPVMRRVYDEVVPEKLNEHDFWARFFQSKLFSKLRGFKIDDRRDAQDVVLDAYLQAPELTGVRPTPSEMQIPKFLDMEGNEENHSQRKGNRPDNELRPQILEKAPIIRTLNSLSEKLLAHVQPSDVDPAAPIGMDEATYNSLRLRDLAGDPEQERIILHIQDQSRFFSETGSKNAVDTPRYRQINPTKAIQAVCTDLSTHFPHPGAEIVQIPEDPANTSNPEEDDEDYNLEFGSTLSEPRTLTPSERASTHILSLIHTHRAQTTSTTPSSGLSSAIYDRLTLTHATTLEFLHQFWSAFLSGDPSRTAEIASLIESLSRALDRIDAVGVSAEQERMEIVAGEERRALEILRRTGKRRTVDYGAIGGGQRTVRELLGPVVRAVGVAKERFEDALREQMGEGEGT